MKKFKIENFSLNWEMSVAIDEEKAMPFIKEMVEFWAGWESLLADFNGDYLKAFLKMLGAECLQLMITEDYTLEGLIGAFDQSNQKEGWCPLDGTYGIEIIDADDCRIYEEEFSISEI